MLTAKPRADLTPHWALWVIARDMATDAPFPVGYWTGDDATTITAGPSGPRGLHSSASSQVVHRRQRERQRPWPRPG